MIVEGRPPVVLEVEVILGGFRARDKVIARALLVGWRCLSLPRGVPIEIHLASVKASDEVHSLL